MIKTHWRSIRDAIERDIEDGVLARGSRLPTEPELAEQYRTGRHTIRRAVAELGKEGLLSVEQGRGTFVQQRPVIDYTIGKRTRLRENLSGQALDVSGRLLGIEHLAATGRVAGALGIAPGAPVIATSRLSLADGVPVSFGTLFHDATRFPDFPERREALGSVSAVYRSYGVADYERAKTTIRARPARDHEAKMLKQHGEMAVLDVRAIDQAMDGSPIAYSEVIWSAARVQFTMSGD